MVSQTTKDALAAFVAERNWGPSHTPENLAKSISIEAAELLECYQWTANPDPKEVAAELADVLTYCLHLAAKLGLDPEKIVLDKLEVTRGKYPVAAVEGKGGEEQKDGESN